MQNDASVTLHNLHVLGSISHNDKLQTNHEYFEIYQPTSFRGMWRMWLGEERRHNIRCIRTTITVATSSALRTLADVQKLFELNKVTLDCGMKLMEHERIVKALRECIPGLNNLARTYKDDAAGVSQIRVLVEELQDFIHLIHPQTDGIKRKLSEMFPPTQPPRTIQET
jgi:hypothetical protein